MEVEYFWVDVDYSTQPVFVKSNIFFYSTSKAHRGFNRGNIDLDCLFVGAEAKGLKMKFKQYCNELHLDNLPRH